MGRKPRLNAPGMPFHVTARTQRREPLFSGLEARIVAIVVREAAREDDQLLAFAVMPNHIHLVVRQGGRPLGRLMQCMLRRIALLVQRKHGCEGHVFERRYFAALCADPQYFRSAIAYVHLNPVRAGICAAIHKPAWTSHELYRSAAASVDNSRLSCAARTVLQVFAAKESNSIEECHANYLRFITWRHAADLYLANGGGYFTAGFPRAPATRGGDAYWNLQYATVAAGSVNGRGLGRPDIRDIVRAGLVQLAPGLHPDQLRGPRRLRAIVDIRREIIARCLLAGYRTHQIATFFNISSSTVSAARPS